ncbi:MAG: cytochrome C [Pseudomonadota bacterium]
MSAAASMFRLVAACLLLWLLPAQASHAQTVESVLAPGVLVKAHAKWDNSCRSCHIPFDRKAQDKLCVDCHKDIGRDLAERTGLHGRQKPQPCRSCHTDHRGRDVQIAPLDTRTFDHQLTDYALRGKHRETDCSKCHAPGRKYSAAGHDCQSCHRKDDVHKAALGPKCESCHDERNWRDTRFDHSKTRFELNGAHQGAKCESCHKSREYKETPMTCIGCHRKDDKHKAQFGDKCESCHGERRWRDISFRHDTDTRYPLRDRHREVRCTGCHTTALYREKTATECVSCHRKDDRHKGTLGQQCASCHTERGWKEVQRFDHDRTAYPLLGRHVQAACKDCHQSQVYREAPSTCVACHRKDDRHEAKLGERCADCHTETNWKATRFDHARTRFALRGGHAAAAVACKDCHRDLRSYRDTPTGCLSCHRKDDKHEAQLGERCESCHDDVRWNKARFDHAQARFALGGAHAIVPCRGCHESLRYRDAPRDCIGCHRKDDRHKNRFGSACESCHNVRAWRLWRFDHERQTHYPLTGAHVKVSCETCHTQPAPAGRTAAAVSRDCVACHAKDDAHDRDFGARCDQCHVTTRWNQVRHRSPGPAPAPVPASGTGR